MGAKDFINKIKKEAKVLQGEETKNKLYYSNQNFPDETSAREAYDLAVQKLFAVEKWSDAPGVAATFELFDSQGKRSPAKKPAVGDFFRILLPGPWPENWVQVAEIREEDKLTDMMVHPSEKPRVLAEGEEAVAHFFTKEASSTFRVELRGYTLWAYEIGENERINNRGEEAGDRAVANTVIAEGGWAGVQKFQWECLTDYLVHLTEVEEEEEKSQ